MKHIKIFWVDDIKEWTDAIVDNLTIVAGKREIELHVVHALNGEDINQQLMQFDFDLIIMDYNMEPSNGDKYIQDVRNEEHLDQIPILFYSQDNNADLDGMVADVKNITTVYRPNLEDKVIELFFG